MVATDPILVAGSTVMLSSRSMTGRLRASGRASQGSAMSRGEIERVRCRGGAAGELLPPVQSGSELSGDPDQLRTVDAAGGVGVGGEVYPGSNGGGVFERVGGEHASDRRTGSRSRCR